MTPSSTGLQPDLAVSSNISITLIVAVADNGVIGRGNALPWRLPSDLKRFKSLTVGGPVIMGRKTYQSIGKPLPQRTNIVLTRDPAFRAAGVVTTTSLDDALKVAAGDALRRGAGGIAVIGGAEIYALAMPRATTIELTRVHAAPEGDAQFATPDPALWQEVGRETHDAAPGDSANFSYVSYRRIAARQPRAAKSTLTSAVHSIVPASQARVVQTRRVPYKPVR